MRENNALNVLYALTQEYEESQGTYLRNKSCIQEAPGCILSTSEESLLCSVCNHLFHLVGKLTFTPTEIIYIYIFFLKGNLFLSSRFLVSHKYSCLFLTLFKNENHTYKKSHIATLSEWLLQYQLQ